MVALLIGLFSLCSPLLADIFHLKDGRTIEGTILRELGDLVSIRTGNEVVTVDRSQILRIETSETVNDKYRKKADALAPDDALGHLELALWCERSELKSEARLHFTIVVGITPEDPLARKKLGFEWIAGTWYLKGSPEAIKRREELENIGGEDAHEIPEELRLGDWKKQVKEGSGGSGNESSPIIPEPVSGGPGITIGLLLDERLGRKPPDPSAVAFELNSTASSADPPIRFVPTRKNTNTRYQLEVRIRCYFVRTQHFYKVPITDIFQGEVVAALFESLEDGSRKKVASTRLKAPFSWSSRRDREKALDYTYYATVRHLAAKVSRWSFLASRGVEPRPPPGEDE
ncbi:MAG TPA: hypothetical protein EYN79_01345 [Planctomycetes bacterium]|nr:hypothetical protein [Planctomycetota bacterium]